MRAQRSLSHRIAILLAVVVPLASVATAAEDVMKWLEPSDDFVTPHIAWKKPASGGTLKVLFITHMVGMREIVEVCQRFDIDREVFCVWDSGRFAAHYVYQYRHFPGVKEKEVEARLREKLARDYDLIVVAGINWDTLPEWARTEICAKVSAGTGLVARLTKGMEDLLKEAQAQGIDRTPETTLSAYPFKALPAYRHHADVAAFARATIRLAQADRGRIGLLAGDDKHRRQVLVPSFSGEFPDLRMVRYDYYLALLGHVFDWAAGRETEVRVVHPKADVLTRPREDFDEITFTVANRAKGAKRVILRFVLRDDREGEVRARTTRGATLAPGTSTASFEIDAPPAGGYFADLWIAQGSRVAGYGSVAVQVTSAVRIADVKLNGTSFAETPIFSMSRDDPTSVAVKVVGIEQEGLSLDVSQSDNHGRLVARAKPHVFDPDWAEQEPQFKLRPISRLTVPQHIELVLKRGDEVLQRRRETFFYNDVVRPIDNVRAVLFNGYLRDDTAFPLYHYARLMRESGFDMMGIHTRNVARAPEDVDTLFAGRMCVLANQELIIGTTGIGRIDRLVDGKRLRSDLGPVRKPCLTSGSELPSMKKGAQRAAEDWKPFSVKYFNVGDEKQLLMHGGTDDLCFSPTCVADFREWIRRQYTSLEALNAEYGTSFATWDDVVPIDLETCRKTGEIPRWMDHRAHMENVWARHMTEAGERIRRVIPFATTGTMGSNDRGHSPKQPALGGVNYWEFVRHTNPNLNYYYPVQLDAARDFAGRDALIGVGLWGGYHQLWRAGIDPLHHRWWIWNGLLRGANAITVYTGLGGQSPLSCNTVAPDFSFFWWMDTTLAEIKRVQQGPGALLLACERPHDGIAVLYSAPSMNLTTFFPDFPTYWDALAAVPIVFTQAGFQYRLVAEDEIEEDLLRKGGFKALFLPHILALSDEAAAKIRAFVQGGGSVIADLRPAIADGHGKLRTVGALDDVFGVRQDVGASEASAEDIEVTGGAVPRDLPQVRVDLAVKLAGGKALGAAGDAPAVVVNDYGSGKAIFLNIALCDTVHPRNQDHFTYADDETDTVMSAFFRNVMGIAGLKPAVPLTPHVPGAHVMRFRSGDALVMGLMWDAPGFLPGTVRHEPEDYGDLKDQKKSVALELPQAMHVYDVLGGRYVGHMKTVRRQLQPGLVHLLAALPYEVASVSVEPARDTVKQGRKLKFRASVSANGAEAGVHILRIELTDPEGAVADVYTTNARAERGAFDGSIPLALNEKTGEWKITATDVVSGKAASTTFTVKQGK